MRRTVQTPIGKPGMVIENNNHYSKVLFESGEERVFDTSFLTPTAERLSALPLARLGNDKLTTMMDKLYKANVGRDEFQGDVLIPYKKLREIILNEIRGAQWLKL